MHKGILYLISSKNPPVFDTPMEIRYAHIPKVGDAFYFASNKRFESCHLSQVQDVVMIDGYSIISTLNSKYCLYPMPKEVTI